MRTTRVLFVVGAVVAAVGGAMLSAAAVSALYGEWWEAGRIGLAAACTVAVGVVTWKLVGSVGELSAREGLATVGLAWLAVALVGVLPYLFTGSVLGVTNAFFESAAGFTTTGATVIPDPADLPRGILFWRALTQWLGGMGIIVLSVAILPLLGIGGLQLVKAEAPGPEPDRLTPRFRETAKRLWVVYLVFTVLDAALLAAGEMTLFEGIAHALTTMSTGGFGTAHTSFAAFSAYSQWVTIVFMALAATSFALHYRGLRRPSAYPRNRELRLLLGIILGASGLVVLRTWGSGSVEEVVRTALFNVTSVVTTTGYASEDFAAWTGGLQILIVGLMFIGGMTGSTAGSVKVFRIGVLTRASVADLRRAIHPRGVFVTRFGKERVPEPVVEGVQAFFLLYMFLFMTGTLLMGLLETTTVAIDLDLVTSASAVASALGNVGPGLGLVGPTGSYLIVPTASKWLLSILMIVGRLEIYPVLLLLTPELWRR